MSDTNRVKLNATPESSYGVVPTTPTMTEVPVKSIGLKFNPKTVVSERLRSDRQVDDLALVGADAQGEVALELSYGAFDQFLEAAFFSTWQARYERHKDAAGTTLGAVTDTPDAFGVVASGAVYGPDEITFTSGPKTLTRPTGSFIDDGFAVGQAVLVSGATDSGNNQIVHISVLTDLVMTVPETIADETSDPAVTLHQLEVDLNDIIRTEGYAAADNNGFFFVGTRTSATAVLVTDSLVAEATPPVGAKLHHVGRRSAAGDLDLTITSGTGTLASTLLNFLYLGLQAGDWIKLAGFTAPADNGFYRISAVAANLLSFDEVPTSSASESPAGAVDIYFGERLVNGVLQRSFTFEERFTDHDPETFQYFRGMCVDTLSLSAAPQSIIKTSLKFLGKDAFYSDEDDPDTTHFTADSIGRVNGAVDVAYPLTTPLNSSSNVGRIGRGGVPVSGVNYVLDASIDLSNNLRERLAVGVFGAVSIGAGEFSVKGKLSTYFDNKELAQAVINNSESSFDIRFGDNDAHQLLFDLPRIKFSQGSPDVASKNQDVTTPLEYQALRHPVLNYTAAAFRFAGVQ